VNEAPASAAKKTLDTIARCPDDDTGRNSVKPCTTAKTMTCHQDIAETDIAETAVTTTTVPGAGGRYRVRLVQMVATRRARLRRACDRH
jgi:hypothetical protein